MTPDDKIKHAVELGAQIARLEAQLEERLAELRENHERQVAPFKRRLAALMGIEGGTAGEEPEEPQLPENPTDLLAETLRAGPATLTELTSILYGPAFADDRKYRGRTSARLSHMKKDYPALKKRGDKYLFVEQAVELPPPPPPPAPKKNDKEKDYDLI